MNYINKFTRKKILLIQEQYQEKTKRNNVNRGFKKYQNIKSHKIMLSSDKEEDTEHEKEIEKRAKILFKYGKFKTFEEALNAARQEQNRKEGK